MLKLLDLLHTLEAKDNLPDDAWRFLGQEDEDNVPLSEEEKSLVSEIEGAACQSLIDDKGRTDLDTYFELKRHGFKVGPGEQDSFGWLTGVIYTRKGRIVYG